MVCKEIHGSCPLKGYGLHTSFSRAVGSTNFVAVGRFAAAIQPTVKMSRNRYLKAVGSVHLNVSFLWNSEKLIFPLGGLKPTATKLTEPTALKNLCINHNLQKDDFH